VKATAVLLEEWRGRVRFVTVADFSKNVGLTVQS